MKFEIRLEKNVLNSNLNTQCNSIPINALQRNNYKN